MVEGVGWFMAFVILERWESLQSTSMATPGKTTDSAGTTGNPGARAPSKPESGAITIRLLHARDSISEITGLLHRAYARQVAMGLQPLAGRQDDETTQKRVHAGECYLAVQKLGRAQKIVGTILFHEVEDAKGPPWFQ